MEREVTPSSPRIVALDGELERGNAEALSAFWDEVGREGAPIIEELEGDASQRLVTFVWRDEQAHAEPTRNVIVVGHAFGWDFAKNQLRRLRESDVWFFTVALPAATRTTYTFARNDSLLPLTEDPDFADRLRSFLPDPLARRQQIFPANTEDDPDDQEFTASILELLGAPPQPWAPSRVGVAAGEVTKHRVASATLGNERSVWVYTPPGYDPSRAEPAVRPAHAV